VTKIHTLKIMTKKKETSAKKISLLRNPNKIDAKIEHNILRVEQIERVQKENRTSGENSPSRHSIQRQNDFGLRSYRMIQRLDNL